MQRWVLQRTRVRDVWSNSTQPHFRTRIIESRPAIQGPTPSFRESLPGGRWLLVGYTSAIMYALDLENPSPPRMLFNHAEFDQGLPGRQLSTDYNLWIDWSKPRLSFRVAGTIRERGELFRAVQRQPDSDALQIAPERLYTR